MLRVKGILEVFIDKKGFDRIGRILFSLGKVFLGYKWFKI